MSQSPDTHSPARSARTFPHIFITGQAGHGKDSIGDHLVANYGFERMSFSHGIREEVAQAYVHDQVTVAWLDRRDIKETPQMELALEHCTDRKFVETCLDEFKKEDDELFQQVKGITRFCDCFTPLERLRLPRSPRRIQQIWGTEYRRSEDPLYWIKYAEEKTDFSRPQVLTSVRYPNELDLGVRIHAVRIHVERPDSIRAADHITERPLPMDEHTVVIQNDKTLADLHHKVDAVMAALSAQATLEQAPSSKQPRP
jgi:hypothetical protein